MNDRENIILTSAIVIQSSIKGRAFYRRSGIDCRWNEGRLDAIHLLIDDQPGLRKAVADRIRKRRARDRREAG